MGKGALEGPVTREEEAVLERRWRTLAAVFAVGFLLLGLLLASRAAVAQGPVTQDDPRVRMPGTQPDPENKVDINDAAGCLGCHGGYNPSVEPGHNWQGSMMANSARDPYWQAGVRREILEHPEARGAIEDKCASCHMPMARFAAKAAGSQGKVFGLLPVAPALTEEHVRAYSEITGDRNPLHSDLAFTSRTRFGKLIVQGGLTTGLLHALVAMDLPAPGTVFLEQNWPRTACCSRVAGRLRRRRGGSARAADHRRAGLQRGRRRLPLAAHGAQGEQPRGDLRAGLLHRGRLDRDPGARALPSGPTAPGWERSAGWPPSR
mgnify:CR=1 FL=1